MNLNTLGLLLGMVIGTIINWDKLAAAWNNSHATPAEIGFLFYIIAVIAVMFAVVKLVIRPTLRKKQEPRGE